ncbi:hypothetical protein Back11_52460 [Paenibacillus baekrokdamisoli]|uniref:Uncharacterized protein n=1 Tax=Paenibacillus baekrokdamisoli TaxID=1712516 RepID=A0A3G9JDC4_9BACL|nr:TIGR03826 family flagellar region protein [Paenibacillus baekrokdamisoli]MBB3069087.1 flagellar operon protein (TIGR03826 family) [Paenibacillus baekrokdamisoli]BBH23901.1 hypothetical protein Back11_52460 [Paenibacillus baekrokdamisoli]
MNLDNCPRCGKLYAKNFRDVCPACMKSIDTEYQLCSDFLRKNKGADITFLSEETNVSIKQITKFIREGRISLIGVPNLMYPCEVCGTLIRENNMCIGCRSKLIQDVNKSNNAKSDKAKETEKVPPSATAAYRIMDRRERN